MTPDLRASGLCAYHAKDACRAQEFAELAAVLTGTASPAAMPAFVAVAGFRQQAAVAS
jgi:hypothetical protein